MLACAETTLLLWFLSEQLLLTLVPPASLPIKEADWFWNQLKLWNQLSLLEVGRISENRILAGQLPCRVRTMCHLSQTLTVSTWRSNLHRCPEPTEGKIKKEEEGRGEWRPCLHFCKLARSRHGERKGHPDGATLSDANGA